MMPPLATQVVGLEQNVLLVAMPPHVTQEVAGVIEEEVRNRLPRVTSAVLILDFSGVSLINSIGITCLLQLQAECRKRQARMYLAALPEPIAKFLRQLKLDRRFLIAPTVEAAMPSSSA
jgi:anti-anti-sigma factor